VGNDGKITQADRYGRTFETETYGTGHDSVANPELRLRWAVAQGSIVQLGLETRAYLPIENGTHVGVMFALPLRLPDSAQRGLLVFYADDRNYFRRVGLAPFEAFARLSEVALAQSAARVELAAVARTDPLTRIANRRAFQEACLNQLLARGSAKPLSLLLVDVDHFKNVNDEYGHENGDRVLVQIARCMGEALRSNDLIGRWGGEEFVALLPDADAKIALLAAERLRAAVDQLQPLLDGGTVPVTCSVGVATFPLDATTMDRLLQVADQRLMEAKRAGRNRVRGRD